MSTKTAPASTAKSIETTSPRSRNKKSRPATVRPSGRDYYKLSILSSGLKTAFYKPVIYDIATYIHLIVQQAHHLAINRSVHMVHYKRKDLLLSYHLQSLNQMLEFSETYA